MRSFKYQERLRGPAAKLFISRGACSREAIVSQKSSELAFIGHRTIIAQDHWTEWITYLIVSKCFYDNLCDLCNALHAHYFYVRLSCPGILNSCAQCT